MRKLLQLLFAIAPLSVMAQTCDILQAWGGGLFLTLQPGVPQTVSWDFSGCQFGIQNYTIYVTQPRDCPSCLQRNLKPNTPLTLLATNLTTGASTACPGFSCMMGTVSGDQIQLTLTLGAKAKKPLDVEIGSYGAIGGPP